MVAWLSAAPPVWRVRNTGRRHGDRGTGARSRSEFAPPLSSRSRSRGRGRKRPLGTRELTSKSCDNLEPIPGPGGTCAPFGRLGASVGGHFVQTAGLLRVPAVTQVCSLQRNGPGSEQCRFRTGLPPAALAVGLRVRGAVTDCHRGQKAGRVFLPPAERTPWGGEEDRLQLLHRKRLAGRQPDRGRLLLLGEGTSGERLPPSSSAFAAEFSPWGVRSRQGLPQAVHLPVSVRISAVQFGKTLCPVNPLLVYDSCPWSFK